MSQTNGYLAVFPGMFDPPTLGHVDIANRASRLFDRLTVAVGVNPEQAEWFPLHERVTRMQYGGLTVDYVRAAGANFLVRGIRDTVDLRDEIRIANVNLLISGVETVFLMTHDEHALTASSLIRQIVDMGGFDAERMARLVPEPVIQRLARRVEQNGGG